MVALSLVAGPAAFVACGPPSSFDGVTGGAPDADAAADGDDAPTDLVPDPALPPPRPIAPLSVSWIPSGRPRFRWELAPGTVGARIEACRSRACDGDKEVFEASGDDLTAPRDLAPGVWFWRLFSKTASSVGTTPSAVWEVLVRGGPSTSAAGSGGILDLDGDGRAELLVTLEHDDGPGTLIEVVALFATNADSTAFETGSGGGPPPLVFGLLEADTRLAGGADVDGDGYADFVFVDGAADGRHEVVVVPGGPTGIADDRVTVAPTPPLAELPDIGLAGDIDGDGRGDLAISTREAALAFFGTPRGFGPFQYMVAIVTSPDGGVAPDAGLSPFTEPIAVHGGFDRNADGLSDVALASPLPEVPLFLLLGDPIATFAPADPVFEATPPPTRPTAFASGDFDGDGLVDLAFATTVGGAPSVCLLGASEPVTQARVACFTPPAAPPGFGESLAAGDLEGDGRDEVLVGSTSAGVEILRRTGEGVDAEHLATPYGASITTILPGRPGPAVWASTRADGASLAVFRGAELANELEPLVGAARFGRRIR